MHEENKKGKIKVMPDIYNKLIEYSKKDYYPFHTPGHKRNIKLMDMVNPYTIDITEIDGFDDLHCPEGIIREAMEKAAYLYGAEETFFSVNGSTGGLIASITACMRNHKKIVIARNCHKSVYNAILLNNLKPIYIYPERIKGWNISSQISPHDVEELLITNSDIGLVVVTSPTYEGVVSDIEKIAEVVHGFNIPLLVDEAHGAHFGFNNSFPKSSIQLGADIVVQSLHKTLPCFTQTAIVHVKSKYVNKEQVKKYLNIYQTTSPSYLFLAGIGQCMYLLEKNKEALFKSYVDKLQTFYEKCKQLKCIELLREEIEKKDLGKLVISVKNSTMTGKWLYDILRDTYHLQMEMAADHYVIAMTSIADTSEGFNRLWNAFKEIDSLLEYVKRKKLHINYEYPTMIFTPCETERKEAEQVYISNSVGRITKEYIYLYPPGIPILVPGEQITDEILKQINYYKENNLRIKGLTDEKAEQIRVVKEE